MDALIAQLQRQFRDYTISLYRQWKSRLEDNIKMIQFQDNNNHIAEFVSWTEYISRRWKQIIRRKHDLEAGAA